MNETSMLYVSNLTEILPRYGITTRRTIGMLEFILVISLAISFAELVWDLVPAPENIHSTQTGGDDMVGYTVKQEVGYEMAAEISPALREMFGKATTLSLGSADIDGPVQETRLNLTLKGILAHSISGNRLALIARGDQKEEVYRVGDKIEGAEIIAIESRRVLMRRNGMTEALILVVQKLQTVTNRSARTGTDAVYTNNRIQKISDYERVVSNETFTQQLKNLPRLLQQAKTVPHIEDGQQAGFRVVAIQSGSVFRDLGIEQEDIIRSVNGTPVRTVEEALNAYRNLRTAKAFQLDLLRGGREVTINFSVQ